MNMVVKSANAKLVFAEEGRSRRTAEDSDPHSFE